LAGNVTIGVGAFLGVGCAAIPGVSVGAWTVVGAGAVLVNDLPAKVLAVGTPARVIKKYE
jgi:acetyltransferase-like isoleucine patch superfamily enzyme